MVLELAKGDITRVTLSIFLNALEKDDQLAKEIMGEVAGYLAI